MSEKLFYSLKINLIELGIKENKLPDLEKYLEKNKGNIIFIKNFISKFELTKKEGEDILIFLLKNNILEIIYRVRYNSDYWDFYNIREIPREIEVGDTIITNILEKTIILFRVKENE